MRLLAVRKGFFFLLLVPFLQTSLSAQDKMDLPPAEPELISVFPVGGRQGSTVEVEVRGRTLAGVYEVWFDQDVLRAQIKKVEEIEWKKRKNSETLDMITQHGQRVLFEVRIDPAARTGTRSIRLVSPRGVSNSLPFVVHSYPVVGETQVPHGAPGEAQLVAIGSAVDAKISQKGETDYYCFDVVDAQTLDFVVISKPVKITASGAGGLDPYLALYEASGSWFDPQRAVRLAFNDEPASHHKTVQPQLTYRFSRRGRYFLEVGALGGRGGPDYSYQLRIAPADRAAKVDAVRYPVNSSHAWQERNFSRPLGANWLKDVRARTVLVTGDGRGATGAETLASRVSSKGGAGGDDQNPGRSIPSKTLATFVEQEPNDRPVPTGEAVSVPGVVEGAIDHPGDIDTFKIKIESGQQLVFEIETPGTEPPEFNPRLGIQDESGQQLATNVYKRVGKNLSHYLNTIEAKTLYSFRRGGEYYLQIRDITSRWGSPRFQYRILLRPQIPHLGVIRVRQDRINLAAGEARKLTLISEQEEGFEGEVVFALENLPEGVQVGPGAESETDKGPPIPLNGTPADAYIHKERFVPKSTKTTVMLVAAATAPVTRMPHLVRVSATPVVQGRPGVPFPVREIPLMVVKP